MSDAEARRAVREKVLGGLQARTPEVQAMVDSPLAQPLLAWSGERTWDVWARPGLDLKTRCLVNVAMLAAMGTERELRFHIRGALRNGNTPEEIAEVVMQLANYAGMPLATEAMLALIEVAESFAKEQADAG
ncbi:carboxymuconolactone decarboxylase family protein [Nocardia sp. CA-135953]|uniref:carboxymuconolactone decarboxylase family protein n=1 Tax=Nocardia sp. CA-135953 TaxID=3239978 RepID=UPI003D99BAAB